MAEDRFDAVIVGGSVAGLMHALVLQALGRDVLVLEHRRSSELKAQAAGLSLGPHAQELMKTFVGGEDIYGLHNPASQILTKEGSMMAEIPISTAVMTSSWSVVFDRLKNKFEKREASKGNGIYKTGKTVIEVDDVGDCVSVKYRDVNGEEEKTVTAKLVIAADGCRSGIRQQFAPEVETNYAGYRAWRGSVEEFAMPTALQGALEGKMVMHMVGGSYILAYLTPGPTGSMTPGERLLDWCWYEYCERDSSEFTAAMTDASGHVHRQTVPRGQLSSAAWEKQLARAEGMFPAPWFEVIQKATSPFVTAITSFESSRASFCGGKVLLAGEAFTQYRPHLGLSCDLAGFQALGLAGVLKGTRTIEEWERESAEHAMEFAAKSSATGHFAMTGKWPEGYVPPHLRGKA